MRLEKCDNSKLSWGMGSWWPAIFMHGDRETPGNVRGLPKVTQELGAWIYPSLSFYANLKSHLLPEAFPVHAVLSQAG